MQNKLFLYQQNLENKYGDIYICSNFLKCLDTGYILAKYEKILSEINTQSETIIFLNCYIEINSTLRDQCHKKHLTLGTGSTAIFVCIDFGLKDNLV